MKKNLLFIAVALMATACTSDDKKAAEMYDKAEEFYTAGAYETARQWVDSIEVCYPKAFDAIKKGMVLQCRINQKVYERDLIVTDSLYNIAQSELSALMAQFTLTREGEQQTDANYIYKKQMPAKIISKSELRAQVTEKGDFRLMSIYHGSGAIKHTGIRIEHPDGSYNESATIAHDGAKNYRFSDGGKTTEIITYNTKQCRSIAEAIAQNNDEKLTVRYVGGKKYSLPLTKNSRQAIAQSYRLSQALALTDSLTKRRAYNIKQLELADAQLIKLENQAKQNTTEQ